MQNEKMKAHGITKKKMKKSLKTLTKRRTQCGWWWWWCCGCWLNVGSMLLDDEEKARKQMNKSQDIFFLFVAKPLNIVGEMLTWVYRYRLGTFFSLSVLRYFFFLLFISIYFVYFVFSLFKIFFFIHHRFGFSLL